MRFMTIASALRICGLALLCAPALPQRAQDNPAPEPAPTPAPVHETAAAATAKSGFPLDILEAAPGEVSDGMIIGTISLEIGKLYDSRIPKEAGSFGRAANHLHFLTRESVVRQELLFQEGDPYSEERIAQTERNLRETGLFIRVRIYTLPPEGGRVPILVRVQDAWSLQLSADFGRAGGVNSHSFSIKDNNVLGTGVSISTFRSTGFQSSEAGYGLAAPRILGSRDNLTLRYSKLNDGRDRLFNIERPFYAIDSRNAHLLYLEDTSSHMRLYEDGAIRHEYKSRAVGVTLDADWLARQYDAKSVLRLGGGWYYADRHVDLLPSPLSGDLENIPESLRVEGPFIKFNWVHQNFRRRMGILHPGRDQDFNLGLNVTSRFVFSSPAFGGNDARGQLDTGVSWDHESPNGRLMMFEGGWSGLIGLGGDSHQIFKTTLRARRQRPHNNLRAGLFELRTTDSRRWVDYYYIGGSPGLRGFPENQFSGPHSALAVGEMRHYFNWSPLDLMQTGVVAFAEAGAIWGGPHNFSTRSIHGDVGVGLRLALLKISGNTLIKIDFAAPLGPRPAGVKGWQTAVGFRGDF